MHHFISNLFDTSDFPARWYCGNWDSGLGWLHIGSDLATWAAYTAIPLVLIYYIRKRRDFPFHRIFWLFAAFILACGSVHLVEAIIFWHPVYRFSGLMKLLMATVSWATVAALIKVTPSILHLPSLAATNEKLHKEVEQRLKSEESLKALQSRYEAILSGTRSIIWTCDAAWQFTDGQHSWERYTGQPWEQHRGAGWLNAIDETSRATLLEKWKTALEQKSVFRERGFLWHGESASYRPFVIEAVPVVSASGEICEWVGTCNDIYDQSEAEQALKLAEAESNRKQSELEGIYDTAPVGMCLFDDQLRYIRINATLAKINGIAREEHYGRLYVDVLPELGRLSKPIFEEVLSTGQPKMNVEVKGFTPASSEERCWLLNCHPLKDDLGSVWALSVTVQDITDRKRSEEAIRESEQLAKNANLAKSQFLANMSHEIRTPISAILGYAEVLKSHLRDPDNIQCMHVIQRNGEHLLELINDILDLSRIEAGKIELSIQPLHLPQFVNDLIATMQVRADEKNLSLIAITHGKIPKSIDTDPTRLRQILINLVGNAVKFTKAGQVRIECEFLNSGDEKLLQFTVSDTGIGIPENVQQRLFQPFFQGDGSVTRSYGGTGLGLAITKRSVEILGGDIEFTSKYGVGSSFTFRIPCEGASTCDMVELTDTQTISDLSSQARPSILNLQLNCKVLVVDDRRDIRFITQHFLESVGATVVTAEDGEQALEIVRTAIQQGCPFDLIIMDMQMPKMDGKEATQRLRAEGVTLPIIALTADAMKGDREKYLTIGCTDYLSKPIDRRELLELVSQYHHPDGDSDDLLSSEVLAD